MQAAWLKSSALSGTLGLGMMLAGCAGMSTPPTPVGPGCVASQGVYAYVLNSSPTSGTVSMFAMNDCTGGLTALNPATVATGANPKMVVVTPNGQFVYVVNAGDNTVSMYSAADTGVLTPLTPPTVPTGNLPQGLAVDSLGRFVYAANSNDNTVSMYTINPGTGMLTPTTPPTFAAGSGPDFVTLTESAGPLVEGGSGFAYVSNQNDDTVSMYSVNQTTGVLRPLTPATVATGPSPVGVTLDPGGYAYVPNEGGNTISVYSINTDGTLTSTGTVTTGNQPTSVAVPSSRFAYVVNRLDDAVSTYTINDSTGNLTPNGTGTVPTNAQPFPIILGPYSNFAFVVNESGSVSIYSLNSDGTLTNVGTAATGNGSVWIAVTAVPHAVPADQKDP
ncbi:MAG: beta-propeller fold lactonase family protein [Candidatus Acidiferrales bacterium]